MGISGKYSFPGIRKAGATALAVALSSTPYTAWFLKGGKLSMMVLEFLANLLANNGLIILNLGAIHIENEWDKNQFDMALDQALTELEVGRDKITPAHGKELDDAVINAARRFIPFSKP